MIKVIDNFLTDDECKYYIDKINNHIKCDKIVPFSTNNSAINCKYIDISLVQIFYDKLVDKMDTEHDFIGPNNLVMWAKYSPGNEFGLHTDTGLYYSSADKLKSKYTLMVYLNDDYEGGNTVFYNDMFIQTEVIVPKRGSCLIFDMDLWHRGDLVVSGEKYWIGCEIISNIT